jgi:hypothetical protein
MMTSAQGGIVLWTYHHTAGSSAPVSEIDSGHSRILTVAASSRLRRYPIQLFRAGTELLIFLVLVNFSVSAKFKTQDLN